MPDLLDYLFGAASFMPHGYCLLWRPDLVALHAVADALTAAAYFAIPCAILVFLRRRGDLHYPWMAGLFAAFILACGLTHVADLATLWVPVYGLQGLLKAGTAIISVTTAVALWPLLPRLLALPSPAAAAEPERRSGCRGGSPRSGRRRARSGARRAGAARGSAYGGIGGGEWPPQRGDRRKAASGGGGAGQRNPLADDDGQSALGRRGHVAGHLGRRRSVWDSPMVRRAEGHSRPGTGYRAELRIVPFIDSSRRQPMGRRPLPTGFRAGGRWQVRGRLSDTARQ